MKEGFEEIIMKSKDSIYRICRVYASPPMEPQDLFQEVTFQAWKSYAGFRGDASGSTWIYRIALNVCMQLKSKNERMNGLTTRLDAIQYQLSEPTEEDERFKLLKKCISELNEADRSIMVLYLEEMTYKEIGNITGISENHVAVKMKRIRAKLTQCITQKLAHND